MRIKNKPISAKQMASIHIAYRQWAKLLNDAGYTVNKAIEMGLLTMDVPFTEGMVKRLFGYTGIEVLFPDKVKDPKAPKHPELLDNETQLLFDTLNANFASKFGVSIDFPHKEDDENE